MARTWLDSDSVRYFLRRFQRATVEEAVEAAAQHLREPQLTGTDHYCQIPVDLDDVGQRAGVRLGLHLESQDMRLGALSLEHGQYLARVGTEGTVGQDRFTVAHEIGDSLFRDGAKHVIESLSASENEAEEKICEMFAALLLMPAGRMPAAIEEIPSDGPWDILTRLEGAARQFDVSLPALVFRVGQFRARKSPSLVLFCLAHFPNRFTRTQPLLRVWICSRLGKLRTSRAWYNQSAKGLGLEVADRLFAEWAKVGGEIGEATGGRYALGGSGELVRASRENVRWVPQGVKVSILTDGLWRKCALDLQVASCLYARKGWKVNRGYVLAIAGSLA